MQPIDGDVVLELIKCLVNLEKRWIPKESGYSLYLRPTVIATRLGSWNESMIYEASDYAMLYVLASPTGPYFEVLKPVSLLAVSENVRAWPGGTGGHKVAGNYSPGSYPSALLQRRLRTNPLAAGAMNFFVVVKRDDGGTGEFQLNK
ncbi:aminotransferase, partial [Suillus subaureus]